MNGRRVLSRALHTAVLAASVLLVLAGCATTGGSMAETAMMADSSLAMVMDPMKSPQVAVDRFGGMAGHVLMRDAMHPLPAAGMAVDFDAPPFLVTALGPRGEVVMYYNFDVQASAPAPLYMLYAKGSMDPVAGQLPIVDALPGDPGYSDLHQVIKVTVPSSYAANSVGSLKALKDAGYAMEATAQVMDTPLVPAGSMAKRRLSGTDSGLHQAWYRDGVVSYFVFAEAPLMADGMGKVPVGTLYAAYNVNPGLAGGGAQSGDKMAMGSVQTHNVLSALPGDMHYSPLWQVVPYDSMDFGMVKDLESAMHEMSVSKDTMVINAPVVSVQDAMMSSPGM
jgi:hypothetical protein